MQAILDSICTYPYLQEIIVSLLVATITALVAYTYRRIRNKTIRQKKVEWVFRIEGDQATLSIDLDSLKAMVAGEPIVSRERTVEYLFPDSGQFDAKEDENGDFLEHISIKDRDGKARRADVLLMFKLLDYDHVYLIYSFGEIDIDGMETLHCSIWEDCNGDFTLNAINDPEEWEAVKEVLRAIILHEEDD